MSTRTRTIRIDDLSYQFLTNVTTLKPADKLALIIDLITNNEEIRNLVANELSARMKMVGMVYEQKTLCRKGKLLEKLNQGRSPNELYTMDDLRDIQ